jgi:hypothetical protein
MGDAWDYVLTRAYLYSDIIQRTGPALIAVPVLLFYTFKRQYTMLTGLCLVSLCIYTAGFFLHISLAERFIFATIFSSQILVSRCAWSLAQKLRNSTATTMHTACYALITLLLAAGCAGQLYLAAREYIQPGFTFSTDAPYIRYQDPTAMHKQFARYMHPGDIVFSDVPTSWGIPLYTGAKIVSLFHTPPHVRDNDARKTEVKKFYDPLTDNQQRLHILKKFNATKLVVHYPVAGENIRQQIDAMDMPRIMHNDTVDIFDVPNDAAFPASTDLDSGNAQ